MSILLNVLAAPREAFEQIKNQPRWLFATAVNSAGLFAVLWLGLIWRNPATGFEWTRMVLPALISPLIVGIVSTGSSAFVFLLVAMFGVRGEEIPSFRTIHCLNVHCGVIVLLGEVVNVLLVCSKIAGEIEFALPNRFPLGLDALFLLVGVPGVYAVILLHCTGVFILWYLVILAKGLHDVCGTSARSSGMIAAGLWCVTVGFVLGLVYLAGGGTTIRIAM